MTHDWPTIVTELSPLVWRTAYRLLGNHADAADCFQRTFLAAVEVAGAERVVTWTGLLKRLATARALEQLRARYRDTGRTEPLPDTLPADAVAPDPLASAAAGELAVALREALAAIDPLQAQVFCLVRLEGLSYREAAGQLGVTANHVGVLLNRARTTLRERLAVFNPQREHLLGGPP
jgi:RNA polymerase sigma-70 factor (ECF subfamily)